MPNTQVDLPDINVWLALTDPDHAHHQRARYYWEQESVSNIAFCRITMLGLLRLATNRKVMHGQPFTPEEIWQAYRAYRALPEITFVQESWDVEKQMAKWSDIPDFSVTRWTDCYLAAAALTGGYRLVSFDRDFFAFGGLDFLHLIP